MRSGLAARIGCLEADSDGTGLGPDDPSMVDYPKFEFSKRDVKRAGDMIAGDLIWTDETAPKIREAFLQHSWATSIEAVGLFRGEELKNHQGNGDWLRLFQLMSAEFAEAEQCALPPETPERPERQAEIRKLAKSLYATAVLDSVSVGFGGTDLPLAYGFTPSHYLIKYDHATRTVSVKPYRAVTAATQSYDSAESSNNKTDLNTENVVLVEVDKIANLKAAYPNYFGDVELFKRQLKDITMGKSAVEYAKVPRQPPPRRETGGGDISWVRRNPFPRPDAIKRKRKPKG